MIGEFTIFEGFQFVQVHDNLIQNERIDSRIVELRLSKGSSLPVGHLLNLADG